MRKVLITAATSYLGEKISYELADLGYEILLHYRNEENKAHSICHNLKKKGQTGIPIFGDFSHEKGVQKFLLDLTPHLEDIFALINNAGFFLEKGLLESTKDEMQVQFQLHVMTPFLLISDLLGVLKKNKGSIINIGTAGLNQKSAEIYAPFYHMSKESLLFLTKSYAKELAPYSVGVNMVSPGLMKKSQCRLGKEKKDLIRVDGSDVARVIGFLLDKKNAHITGQNLEVAAGFKL